MARIRFFNTWECGQCGMTNIVEASFCPNCGKKRETDRFVVKIRGYEGVVSNDGTVIIPPGYSTIIPCYHDQLYIVVDMDEDYKCGVRDYRNNEILPLEFEDIKISDSGIIFAGKFFESFKLNEDEEIEYWKLHIFDKWGKEKCVYNQFVTRFGYEEYGVIPIYREGDGWGLINENGEDILPCVYNDIKVFAHWIVVKKNQQWQILNVHDYSLMTSRYYDTLEPTDWDNSSHLFGKYGDSYFLIDSQGNETRVGW